MKTLAVVILILMIATPVSAAFYQEVKFNAEGEYSFVSQFQGPEHSSRITVKGEGKAWLGYKQSIVPEPPDWWDLF